MKRPGPCGTGLRPSVWRTRAEPPEVPVTMGAPKAEHGRPPAWMSARGQVRVMPEPAPLGGKTEAVGGELKADSQRGCIRGVCMSASCKDGRAPQGCREAVVGSRGPATPHVVVG